MRHIVALTFALGIATLANVTHADINGTWCEGLGLPGGQSSWGPHCTKSEGGQVVGDYGYLFVSDNGDGTAHVNMTIYDGKLGKMCEGTIKCAGRIYADMNDLTNSYHTDILSIGSWDWDFDYEPQRADMECDCVR